MDGVIRNEVELITRYREMAVQPELEEAINDIINEAIVTDERGKCVELNLDSLKQPESIKKKIKTEFDNILKLLNFGDMSYDIFRTWYIDGRLFYHLMIDNDHPEKGVQEIRYIDPRRIRKIREVQKTKDVVTGAEIIKQTKEYYLYNDRGILGVQSNLGQRIAVDSIVNINSGLLDARRSMVISYLHKAIKPLNQLRMVEDAVVIYRLSRAPERRVFYIDVGNMPTVKADQYLRDIMTKYRNKLVYDSTTGEIRDDRKHMAMLEDFWLPRREGCFSLDTKIKLLDGRDVELGQLIVEHKLGKKNYTYSVDNTGKIVPGLISWAGVTRNDAKVIKIHLDNGEIITATPDHKFILRNGKKIEAKNLVSGTSLMPFNTRMKVIAKKDYLQIQHNDTEIWEYSHRLVSNYFTRPQTKNEVIHHSDLNRFNNNPENLSIMNKIEHLKLHTKLAKYVWENGNYEEHCKNLSIAGKNFFKTENGLKRKQEISEFNQTSKEIYNALLLGREKIKQNRKFDKSILSHEEYLKKWSPGLNKAYIMGAQKIKELVAFDKINLSSQDFADKWSKGGKTNHQNYIKMVNEQYSLETLINIIVLEVKNNKKISNNNLVENIKIEYPNITINKLHNILKIHGYNSISDCISRNASLYCSPKRKLSAVLTNHTVVKIEECNIPTDVGTLTIDENHIYHNFHNFALSSGIFVMNSRSSEITTLPAGQNLGQIEDVEYFEKKLYKSLGIPFSRLQQGTGFSLGRTTEITRDELKFSKMIDRLRGKFSGLFDGLLKNQLILKKIIAEEDWDEIKEELFYQFLKDNNFEELKEAELNMSRVGLLGTVDPFVGRYYSVDWVKKNILRQTDEEIEEMKEQMEEEQEEMLKNMPKDADGNPLPVDPNTGLPMGQQQDQGQEQQLPAGEEQRQPDPKRKRRFQMSGEDISAMN